MRGGEALLLLGEELTQYFVDGRRLSGFRHSLHLQKACSRHGDHLGVRPQVVAPIFEDETEPPTFVWFESPAELVPCQAASVDDDVVRTAPVALRAPHKAALDVIVS